MTVYCVMQYVIAWLCISDVTASNRISWVKTSLEVNVLVPFPQNLTVAVVTERAELPWCHPHASSEHHVYSNVPVQFEASLPMSANLSFEWKFVETLTGRTADEVTAAGVTCCHGQSCTSSVQVRMCCANNFLLTDTLVMSCIPLFEGQTWLLTMRV